MWATPLQRKGHWNQIQKSALRPGLGVDWEDVGGLALTLALGNASLLHTDEGSDASGRNIILDSSPSASLLPQISLVGGDILFLHVLEDQDYSPP